MFYTAYDNFIILCSFENGELFRHNPDKEMRRYTLSKLFCYYFYSVGTANNCSACFGYFGEILYAVLMKTAN